MEKAENRILFALLNSAVFEKKLADEDKALLHGDFLKEVLQLSKKHDILQISIFALKQNSIPVSSELENEMFKAAYRQKQQEIEFKHICSVFEREEIPFIPLKGSVIRNLYPEMWMRSSCDIDILIKEADIDKAVSALAETEYKLGDNKFHDISLFSPSGVHLELHHSILENRDDIDTVLKNAWSYTILDEKCKYNFTKEFFLFHLFAHLYYHFIGGGCGIRPLLDIYIVKEKWNISVEDAKELLQEASIYEFAKRISLLSDMLIKGEKLDKNQELLLAYILNGGVYGNGENKVTVRKTENQNFISYAFKRMFLPYKDMKYIYPSLKKYPILLPFCYIRRIFSSIFGESKHRAKRELKTLNRINKSQIDDFKLISEYLDLKI